MAVSQSRALRRRRLLAAAASLGAHSLAALAVVFASPQASPQAEISPVEVALVPLPPPPVIEPPAEAPEPTAETEPAPRAEPRERPEPPPPRLSVRTTPIPPRAAVEPVLVEPSSAKGDANAEVSDSELAGAGTAATGAGGGACNMTRRLQAALREDHRVRAAVAEAYRGRALRVWDGDWVRHAGEEGAGLAQVREAIQWEVGFAPEACRRERMRGLVVIAMSDAPGGARLVVGAPAWRWSDLLGAGGRPAG